MKPEEKKSLLDNLLKKTAETFDKLKAPFKVVELSRVEKLAAFKKGDEALKPEKFEDLLLEDGVTMIIIEPAVEVGAAAVMKTVDGEPVAAPKGEYILQDGRTVVIEPDGVVMEVREAATEEEDEGLEKETPAAAPSADDKVKRIIERIETEKIFEKIKELETLCAFLKEENETLKAEFVSTQQTNIDTFKKLLAEPSKDPVQTKKFSGLPRNGESIVEAWVAKQTKSN